MLFNVFVSHISNNINRKEKLMRIKSNTVSGIYKGKWVSGSYIKKDGSRREFHGKLLHDPRSDSVITYLDLTKKDIRRISLHKHQSLTINCGTSHLELEGS